MTFSVDWLILNSISNRYLFYCIDRELDELEREDFTRLKMVKKKKEEQIKQNELDKEEEKERVLQAQIEAGVGNVKIDKKEVISLLSGYDATDDTDIVFK